MELKSDVLNELEQAKKLLEYLMAIEKEVETLKTTSPFLTIKDVKELTGYSMPIVQKLFNQPDFPVIEYGRNKLVYAPAFHNFFMSGKKGWK